MARWKLLAFTLMTWLVLTVMPTHITYASQKANFKVENVTGQVGDTVSVKIDMLNDVDFLAGGFTIDYDSTRLKYESYQLGDVLKEGYKTIVNPIEKEGKIKVEYIANIGQVSYLKIAGGIITVNFKIQDKALYENKVDFTTDILVDSNNEKVVAPKTEGIVYSVVPLVSASLNRESLSLFKDETTTLFLTYSPVTTTDDTTVFWISSDENVATVDKNGLVTAKGEGTATIYARIGDITNSCVVNVTDIDAVAQRVELDRTVETMALGDVETFVPLYIPESLTDSLVIIWSSSDEEVAIVKDGVVTAISEGTAVITLNVQGVEKECVVTVLSKIQKGDLNGDGIVNADDAAEAIDIFKTQRETPELIEVGDMNDDGRINAEDAAIIIEVFKTSK